MGILLPEWAYPPAAGRMLAADDRAGRQEISRPPDGKILSRPRRVHQGRMESRGSSTARRPNMRGRCRPVSAAQRQGTAAGRQGARVLREFSSPAGCGVQDEQASSSKLGHNRGCCLFRSNAVRTEMQALAGPVLSTADEWDRLPAVGLGRGPDHANAAIDAREKGPSLLPVEAEVRGTVAGEQAPQERAVRGDDAHATGAGG